MSIIKLVDKLDDAVSELPFEVYFEQSTVWGVTYLGVCVDGIVISLFNTMDGLYPDDYIMNKAITKLKIHIKQAKSLLSVLEDKK